MSDHTSYEKPPPTAPPPMHPTAESFQTQPPQYGFQPPSDTNYGYPPPYTQQPQPSYNPPQPPPGYNSQPYPSYFPQQPAYNPAAPPANAMPPTVVVLGGCPTCRVGTLEEEFTCCGVCCAIVFFPIGILCCLAMKEKRCQNCGATF